MVKLLKSPAELKLMTYVICKETSKPVRYIVWWQCWERNYLNKLHLILFISINSMSQHGIVPYHLNDKIIFIMFESEIYTLLYVFTPVGIKIIVQYQTQPNRKPTPNKARVCFLCQLRVCYGGPRADPKQT